MKKLRKVFIENSKDKLLINVKNLEIKAIEERIEKIKIQTAEKEKDDEEYKRKRIENYDFKRKLIFNILGTVGLTAAMYVLFKKFYKNKRINKGNLKINKGNLNKKIK